MGRKKTTGETPKTQFRAKDADVKNIEAIVKRLVERDGEADNTKAIRHALRVAARPGVRIVGEVGAGKQRWTKYDREGSLPLAEVYGDDVVAYRVRGSSMVGDHIIDGDHVLVRPQSAGSGGQIVVAWLKGKGAVIKRFDEAKHSLYSGNGRERWNYEMKEGDEILGLYLGLVRQAIVHGHS
jgi:repressor LexA